jgi:hypothetical protein
MAGSHKIEEVWGLVYEVEGAWADDSAHKCIYSAAPFETQKKTADPRFLSSVPRD